jgi:redox-sensitive bicupin YhaK (pirin superfamily)
MILGGATLNGPRYIWWNFVASSKERIELAKEEWRAGDWGKGRFDLPAEGDRSGAHSASGLSQAAGKDDRRHRTVT